MKDRNTETQRTQRDSEISVSLCLCVEIFEFTTMADFPTDRWICMKSFSLIAITFLAVSFSAFSEVTQPPAPTGPYAVGTLSRHLVDNARLETFTDAPDDHRELMIQVWYPAEDTEDKETVPYLPANLDVRRAIFAQLMLPPAKVDELMGPWRTRSVEGATVSAKQNQYPVVLFSHGFGGFRTQNVAQMEELASQGYIVVSIDHTFCAAIVEFPGGRLVPFAPSLRTAQTKPRDEVDKIFDGLAQLWGADASFVIDELEKINASNDDPLAGGLDLGRIGMFGHSFGGATSLQMCAKDARVKCGIDMDGLAYGDARREGVKQPVMIMHIVRDVADPALLALGNITEEQYFEIVKKMESEFDFIAKSAPEGYILTMRQMNHYNFSDFPYIAELSPFRKSLVGDIAPDRGGKIINDYVLAFFGKYLMNQDAPSLGAGALREPEVKLMVYPRP